MSLRDRNARYEGLGPITQGVDSARAPYLLDRTQLAWLVNFTTRENTISTRPGYTQRTLVFDTEDDQTNFEDGLWQGASPYLSDTGVPSILCSISGHIFSITLDTYDITDLSGTDTNNPALPLTWWCQAENFLIIQNGQDDALVYDGANLQRALGQAKVGPDLASVPIGQQMAYNNGRLWVANSPYSFVAGDLAYSTKGTRADVLGFTENTFLNGGGAFIVPFGGGPITAMSSIAVQDNSTGQGPLQIFTSRGCFSVNAPFNRDDWQNVTSPIETISMLAGGASSQFATIPVNGDIWFRAPDGVRSFAIARRDHGTWVNTPLSNEMKRAFNSDTSSLLPYSSAALFDNRLLLTTQPSLILNHGIVHAGLGVLDFDPTSSMFNRSNPNWDGIWTGLRILQILTTGSDNSRCFVFTLSNTNKIQLWELSRSDTYDNLSTRIEGIIETPAYGFDTLGFNLRQLMTGDLWLTNIRGNVDLTIKYRPDTDPNWSDWATIPICSLSSDCTTAACGEPSTPAPQYRARLQLPEPSSSCDTLNDKPTNLGYRFSIRLETTGAFTLQQLRLTAHDLPENVVGSCPPTDCTATLLPLTCLSDYTYDATS